MRDSPEEPGKTNSAIGRVVAWLAVQFDLTTSLLAAFAENDNRTDVDETNAHQPL